MQTCMHVVIISQHDRCEIIEKRWTPHTWLSPLWNGTMKHSAMEGSSATASTTPRLMYLGWLVTKRMRSIPGTSATYRKRSENFCLGTMSRPYASTFCPSNVTFYCFGGVWGWGERRREGCDMLPVWIDHSARRTTNHDRFPPQSPR